MQQGDAGMAETCRNSLIDLATEVRNSIGFFEGQCEESIHRIFVSGGMAKTEMILQTLSDELGLPCEIWDPLETCEVALPAAKRTGARERVRLPQRRLRRSHLLPESRLTMALQLNLLHEEITQERQRKRDPLKLGIIALMRLSARSSSLYYGWNAYRTIQIREPAQCRPS